MKTSASFVKYTLPRGTYLTSLLFIPLTALILRILFPGHFFIIYINDPLDVHFVGKITLLGAE